MTLSGSTCKSILLTNKHGLISTLPCLHIGLTTRGKSSTAKLQMDLMVRPLQPYNKTEEFKFLYFGDKVFKVKMSFKYLSMPDISFLHFFCL